MLKLKLFIIGVFICSLLVALTYGQLNIEIPLYLKVIFIYLIFTTLYSHLKTIVKTGNVNIDYSISYGFSLVLFTGPIGLFIFEIINRFYIYFYRKKTGIADEDEFLHTFYNIGAPTLLNSIGYYIFYILYPYIESVLFGFWILVIGIVILIDILSSLLLLSVFRIAGNLDPEQDTLKFIRARSFIDILKKAISNGLLYLFLLEQRWDVLIALFILNYLVSRSAVLQSQSIQHKIERDQFEQMAYTDFLTNVPNRTYMNKVMKELDHSGEKLGIVVTDIDTFKQINDTYNHSVGDFIIKHFADTLQNQLGKDDYLFRSGGEEFTMILRHKSFIRCQDMLLQLQQNIEASTVDAEFKTKQIQVPYTASFGLYYYKSTEQTEIKRSYVHADDLLLEAKKEGKNRVVALNGMLSCGKVKNPLPKV